MDSVRSVLHSKELLVHYPEKQFIFYNIQYNVKISSSFRLAIAKRNYLFLTISL